MKIERETKARLDKLKEHEKESYNQVIKKILHVLNLVRKNPPLSNRALINIDRAVRRRKELNKRKII